MTTRKSRSDSADAAVRAFQAGGFDVPEGVALRECDLPFWRSAVACRNDWSDAELSMVAALARCKADAERLQRELDGEGLLVNGRANPKFALVETLMKRAVALTRQLQIHARATRGEARQAARQTVASGAGSPLIPRLRPV